MNKEIAHLLNLHEATGHCEKHGAFTCFMRQGDIPYCPKCEEEKEEAEKNNFEAQKKIDDILSNIDGLTARYKNAGFKNFNRTKKNEAAFKKVFNFAMHPGKTWLFLLGNNGTGKTHLAHAVLKVTGGIFREFDDITNEFLDLQEGRGECSRMNLIQKYSSTPMLVLDEIDKVKNTEGRINWLNSILRKRYNNFLPTIICGNIDIETLCQRIDISSGYAMKSRIEEVGEVLFFDWESYRTNLREGVQDE